MLELVTEWSHANIENHAMRTEIEKLTFRALALCQSEFLLSTALISQTLVLCLEKIAMIASIV